MKALLLFVVIFTAILLVAPASAQEIKLDPDYCDGAYYSIPGEPEKCSRAPNACGNQYDDVNTEGLMPNPQACTSEPEACGGYPPLCCYEMARTGDFTKCVGYWERLWCPQVLCDEARANGASDEQCGGSCQCSHAFGSYCGDDVEIVSLQERVGGTAPTNTPTPPSSDPPTPTPTSADTLPDDPTPTPVDTSDGDPSCQEQKLQGNYDCQGGVDTTDYAVWLTDFENKESTLAFFEHWRRANYNTGN